MKVTGPFWFYCKLVSPTAEKYPDKLEKLFALQNIANLQGIGFTPEMYVALLYDRWLTCTSQWTQTRDKLFCKLLMSFQMQKKLLGLQSNQIFN